MAQVIIRNVDDVVIARLRTRAKAEHEPLDQTLREILTSSARPNRDELLRGIKAIRALTPANARRNRFPSAEEMMRDDRDSR